MEGMTKHSKEVLEKYLNPEAEVEGTEEDSGEVDKDLEKLEEIWQDKEVKADIEAKHMPKEKAYRGHKA